MLDLETDLPSRRTSPLSILRRFLDFGCNAHGLTKAMVFLASNFGQEREVVRRRGLPWGGDPQK